MMKTTSRATPFSCPRFDLGVGAGSSEASIDFGAVLNPVQPYHLFLVINPIENSVIPDSEFAERCQLASCFGAYFDVARHERGQGRHGLNLPAKSSQRASRNSSMMRRFCAVNQSSSSSNVDTYSKTSTGISTVAGRNFMAAERTLAAENGKGNGNDQRSQRSGMHDATPPVTISDQAAVTVDIYGGMNFYRLKKL